MSRVELIEQVLPREIKEAAEGWRAALESSPKQLILTALHKTKDGWWLVCVRKESREHLIAKLKVKPEANKVVKLLLAYQGECWNRPHVPSALEVKSGTTPDNWGKGPLGAAVLALTRGERATLFRDWLVVLLNEPRPRPFFPLEHLDWLALVDEPLSNVPQGVGLQLLAQEPEVYEEAMYTLDQVHALDVSKLMGSRPKSAERSVLIDHALGVTVKSLPKHLDSNALGWMADRGGDLRARAMDRVSATELDEFLNTIDQLSFEELVRFRARGIGLRHEQHGNRVATLLGRQRGEQPFDSYHKLFPDDPNPRVELLSGDDRLAWDGLCGFDSGRESSPATIDGLLVRVNQTIQRALKSFSLEGWAWASVCKSEYAQTQFPRLLSKRGLASEGPLPSDPPKLPPDWGWLRAIDAPSFLKRGEGATGPVREWWVKCVEVLRDRKGLSVAELYAEGARTVALDLFQLAKSPPCVLRLVDPTKRLTLPVSEWPEAADGLWLKVYEDHSLWQRLDGLEMDGLGWLAKRISIHRPKLVAAQNALKNMTPVEWPMLRRFAHLLSNRDAVHQIVPAWKPSPDDERDKVLTTLITRAAAGDEGKAQWLRGRLFEGRAAKMPAWTTPELLALLPVLNPVNDVILVVLNRHPIDEVHEPLLLARLLKRLDQSPVSAKPPFRPEWRTTRQKWVDELSPRFRWPAQG